MEKIYPRKALYIKLGKGGRYEKDCLTNPGLVKVGWNQIDHQLCLNGNWEAVRKQCLKVYKSGEQATTSRMNQLRNFYESGEDILWITFHDEYLYWCFAKKDVTLQNDNTKTRPTLAGWSNRDVLQNLLDASRLSGSLLAVQRFQGVICEVKEFNYLVRKINSLSSPIEQKAVDARETLIQSLVAIIQDLHWKEFELLTDLIFRQAGWQRLGVLGKTTKDIDLDLFSPIDQERYKVQVKAKAGMPEFNKFKSTASDNQGFARFYFVVHKPDARLIKEVDNPLMKVWLPNDIARLAVNYGLVDWLILKAK
jgi:hypothetical protein